MPAMPTTSSEDTLIIERMVEGRHALEAACQAAGSPRLAGPPELLAGLMLNGAAEVAEALRAGDAAQPIIDQLAYLLALAEDHVGAEAIRRARP